MTMLRTIILDIFPENPTITYNNYYYQISNCSPYLLLIQNLKTNIFVLNVLKDVLSTSNIALLYGYFDEIISCSDQDDVL